MRPGLVIPLLLVAFAAGWLARPVPPPALPGPEDRLIQLHGELTVVKVLKRGYFDNRIAAFDRRIDAFAAEVDDLPVSDRQRLILLWQLKDYVVEHRVPIGADTWHILDRLPARRVGPDGRYDPARPVASEVRGMPQLPLTPNP